MVCGFFSHSIIIIFHFFLSFWESKSGTDKAKWILVRITVLCYCSHSSEKTHFQRKKHFCHQWIIMGYIAENSSFFYSRCNINILLFTESYLLFQSLYKSKKIILHDISSISFLISHGISPTGISASAVTCYHLCNTDRKSVV